MKLNGNGCVENTIKKWNAIRANMKHDQDTNLKTIQTWSWKYLKYTTIRWATWLKIFAIRIR